MAGSPNDLRFDRSRWALERAGKVIPGGVNSNIRLWEKPQPLFFDAADGAHLWDLDGNRLIDYVMGQGPMLLGHRPPAVIDAVAQQLARGILYGGQHLAEVDVAEAIVEVVPCAEQVRFNMTGSEAVQAALRIARAATGRSKVLKFEGHYHGWADGVLLNVGGRGGPVNGGLVGVVPESTGMPPSVATDLLIAPWNDLAALEQVLETHGPSLAAVIMEPIMANSGVIPPGSGYLEAARALCDRHGVVLIFDEVITGFRVDLGGAQALLGVTPDLAVFGKALASGFPIGCVAGRAALFEGVATGQVMHAGTFNANPVSMAAARATLAVLRADPDGFYGGLRAVGSRLMEGMRKVLATAGEAHLVQGLPTIFALAFTDLDRHRDHRDVLQADRARLDRLLVHLVTKGVRIAGRGNVFLSAAHTDADVEETLARFEAAVEALQRSRA